METRKVCWQDIRNSVKQVNTKLFEIIDTINPGKEYPLYLAFYPYGDLIGDDISLFIPNKDRYYRLNSSEVPEDIKKHLGYGKNSSPLGFVLDKSMEFFIDLPEKKRTIPTKIITAGNFYNFSRILSISNKIEKPHAPNGLLKAASGARTTFALPYLTDSVCFANLQREVGELSIIPESNYEHWYLFKDISRLTKYTEDWCLQLLFFSEKWINSILNDSKWIELKSYLFQCAWEDTNYKRNQYFYDSSFSMMREKINLKTSPYICDTARHILDMSVAAFPGLSPVTDSDLMPIQKIQKSLSFLYGLKKYKPTILAPQYLSFENKLPIYYSMQYPTVRLFAPKSKKQKSALNELEDLRDFLNKLIPMIIAPNSIWNGTMLHHAVQSIDLKFVHTHCRKGLATIHPIEITNRDERFGNVNYQYLLNNNEIAHDGSFFRGCIALQSS